MQVNAGHAGVSEAKVTPPVLEYGVALGAGEARPRLSWTVLSDVPGLTPERYEITLWSSVGDPQIAVIESRNQVLEPWPFAPLRSRQRAEVSVRVGVADSWSPASSRTAIEIGLLDATDWTAQFIEPTTFGGMDAAAPVLFTEVVLKAQPTSARLYVTARGLYEFAINDSRVGNDALTPGWTAYQKRLRYQTYDVTPLLGAGTNSLRAVLGNGWYRGQLVWPGNRGSYGANLGLLAQLEATYEDGSVQTFVTDEAWQAYESGITFDDLYDGQTRDLRVAHGPAGKDWEPVRIAHESKAELVAPSAPSVQVTQEVDAAALFTSHSGRLIVDFGQNLVGWVQLTVRGATSGDVVTIRHAEVLEHGELGVRPLRSAKATSTYVMSGAAEEVVKPTFTFHGFRYAEIEGVANLQLPDVRALVLGSALRRTGWFESSSSELNQLHSNIVWSMRGNFLDIPTDCPARDERLGWTGDIQVFAPTANFLFDTSGFLAGWLRELAAEQRPDGAVPNVVPDVLREDDPARSGWGDAATIVPGSLFESFADAGMLEKQYPSMVAWVEKIHSITGARLIWDQSEQFGDWLDPTAPPEHPARAQAHPGVVATAHFARSTFLLAEVAKLLGHDSDHRQYRQLHADIVSAFNREYVTAVGVVLSDCQTVYALALRWNLLDSTDKMTLASTRLAELVTEAEFRVSTGFIGTPLVLDALDIAGRSDLAMKMLMQHRPPSWLYAVQMGATTIWERWDSMLPDGSINPGTMTSFNHYAYGAVADWLHRRVAGLEPIEPGYQRIRVRPNLNGDLSSASATHDSPYGTILVSWTLGSGEFALTVRLPVGVSAEVWLPGEPVPIEAVSGQHSWLRAIANSPAR